MKLLVTGASGFLGAAVGEAAAAAGHEVLGLGRRECAPERWTGSYRQIDFSPESLVATIREFAPEGVAHFAGTASVGDSFQAPAADFEASTGLWFRVLEAIRCSGCRPVVALASSAAVYGSPEVLPTPEEAPRRPESPYGFHKLLSEQVGEEFARCFDFTVLSLRFFSVFGPRQRRLFVWEMFEQLERQVLEVRLKGTGRECRDFLSVNEAAQASVGLIAAVRETSPGFYPFNIASGSSISVREVAETLRDCAGSPARIVTGGTELRGDPARWQADLRKLREALPDWCPAPFANSLAMCVRDWKSDVATPVAAEPVS